MPIDKFNIDCYDAEEENLLEYMTTVADKFCPDFIFEDDGNAIPVDSQAPFIFKRRYNQQKLKGNFRYEEYMKTSITNDETIQDIIRALGIYADKFWYLLLFVYDYVMGSTQNTISLKSSPIEEIEKFIDYVETNELSFDSLRGIKHSKPIVLTIKKDGAQKITITNPNTISLIASICKETLPTLPINSLFNNVEADKEDASKSMSIKIWLFTAMLRYFFEQYPQFTNKRKNGNAITKSTLKLISKLIYFVKLTDNEDYDYDDENLKAILKQYRNYKINTINRIYG